MFVNPIPEIPILSGNYIVHFITKQNTVYTFDLNFIDSLSFLQKYSISLIQNIPLIDM